MGPERILAVILAGGKGSRLEPLTRDRAKPAVPFGGIYRIIDFTLSNCLNSGIRKILVLTQYKAMSLARHVTNGWRHLLCRELGEFIDVVPPQQRIDEQWYQGTADAVKAAKKALGDFRGTVFILYGDTPLIEPDTLREWIEQVQTVPNAAPSALTSGIPA